MKNEKIFQANGHVFWTQVVGKRIYIRLVECTTYNHFHFGSILHSQHRMIHHKHLTFDWHVQWLLRLVIVVVCWYFPHSLWLDCLRWDLLMAMLLPMMESMTQQLNFRQSFPMAWLVHIRSHFLPWLVDAAAAFRRQNHQNSLNCLRCEPVKLYHFPMKFVYTDALPMVIDCRWDSIVWHSCCSKEHAKQANRIHWYLWWHYPNSESIHFPSY